MSESNQIGLVQEHTAIIDAIKSRRSIGRVKKDPIAKETLQALLEAAKWAPSHHNTQPWRFIVMTGEGRQKLGEGYAKVAIADNAELELDEERLERESKKAFRAPVVIAAICSPGDDKRAVKEEELAAAQAAVQNLLLAAHAHGLGAIWRSGAPMSHPVMKAHFDLRADEDLVGFIYLGLPDMVPPAIARKDIEEFTTWLDA